MEPRLYALNKSKHSAHLFDDDISHCQRNIMKLALDRPCTNRSEADGSLRSDDVTVYVT